MIDALSQLRILQFIMKDINVFNIAFKNKDLLVLWNIDSFHLTNEKYGRYIGDKKIQDVSNILKNNISDEYSNYRFSGNLFVSIINTSVFNNTLLFSIKDQMEDRNICFNILETGLTCFSVSVCACSIINKDYKNNEIASLLDKMNDRIREERIPSIDHKYFKQSVFVKI